MRKKWLFIIPAAIVGMLLFVFIGGKVVQLLWNWLLPPLFGFPAVTFWQGLGLLALCRILFGGHGFSGSSSRRYTSDERTRFRQRIRERLGFKPTDARATGQASEDEACAPAGTSSRSSTS
ncbi:MAG: hypothetical protein ABI665_21315 [Vicinamibacterales bacterium]